MYLAKCVFDLVTRGRKSSHAHTYTHSKVRKSEYCIFGVSVTFKQRVV